MSNVVLPELPQEETKRIINHMGRIMAPASPTDLRKLCLVLGLENAKLCQEVNALRAAQGLPPLPVYQPGR